MKIISYIFITFNIVISFAVNASGNKLKYVDDFDLNPIVLDSDASASSTLGLEYLVTGKLLDEKFDTEEGDKLDPDVVIGGYDISYSLKGTITENSDNNPKNFLESRMSANYFRSSMFSVKAGGFFKSESDQKFDNNQVVYGVTGTFAKIDSFAKNDIMAFHVNYGQVDPSKDTAREAILGSNLDSYNRIDFEALYIYNIGTENLSTFEVNYRHFLEVDADSAIKDADLDEFRLVTYRLGLKNNLYVAYSSGELPFNQKDNQIYEVGFSYKFE